MAALQFVDVPGYSALFALKKTDLYMESSILGELCQWWAATRGCDRRLAPRLSFSQPVAPTPPFTFCVRRDAWEISDNRVPSFRWLASTNWAVARAQLSLPVQPTCVDELANVP